MTKTTDEEIRQAVEQALHRIAPEADMCSLPGSADLREEIDLDSMDMLNFFVALHERLKLLLPGSVPSYSCPSASPVK